MLFALEDTIFVCFVQLRSSLMRIPRYFTSWTCSSTTPSTVYTLCSLFLSTLAMVMITHFDGLNRIPQVEAQRPSCFRSCCRVFWSTSDFMVRYKRHSSAKSQTCDVTCAGRSLMNKCKYSSRPRTTCFGVPLILLVPMMMLLHPLLLVVTCFGGNRCNRLMEN